MELNGVANIKAMIDLAKMQGFETSDKKYILLETDKLLEQLDLLERYMLAYGTAAQNPVVMGNPRVEAPKWHEVRENKEKFPKMKEFVIWNQD